jgi:hypothetical protein
MSPSTCAVSAGACKTCDGEGYVASHDERGEEHILACPDCHATGKTPITRGLRIAIVGSREYDDLFAVGWYVRGLPKSAVIISGGARGVDREAARVAKQVGLAVVEHLPDYATHGRYRAPKIRNQLIVNDCDRLVAFWDMSSGGTADSIEKAKAAGKVVEIIPDMAHRGPR